jgi:hypothetical protein
MKTFRMIFLGCMGALFMSSCTTILPVTASRAEIGSLRGVSQSAVIFGTLYLNKDYGIKDAAKNGNITSAIATIDEKTTNYLFFQVKELIITAK